MYLLSFFKLHLFFVKFQKRFSSVLSVKIFIPVQSQKRSGNRLERSVNLCIVIVTLSYFHEKSFNVNLIFTYKRLSSIQFEHIMKLCTSY